MDELDTPKAKQKHVLQTMMPPGRIEPLFLGILQYGTCRVTQKGFAPSDVRRATSVCVEATSSTAR